MSVHFKMHATNPGKRAFGLAFFVSTTGSPRKTPKAPSRYAARMEEKKTYEGFPEGLGFDPPFRKPQEYLVVDLETTGLSPDARIVEVACVRVRKRAVVEAFDALVRPDIPMPPVAAAVSGITDGMLEREGLEPEEAWRRFAKFVGKKDVPMFAHNMPFDARAMAANGAADFMEADCLLCDSVELARRFFPKMERYSLSYLAKTLGLKNPAPHRALGDAMCCAQLVDACYRQRDQPGTPKRSRMADAVGRPPCSRCGSLDSRNKGFNRFGERKYLCKECGKQFTANSLGPAKR